MGDCESQQSQVTVLQLFPGLIVSKGHWRREETKGPSLQKPYYNSSNNNQVGIQRGQEFFHINI